MDKHNQDGRLWNVKLDENSDEKMPIGTKFQIAPFDFKAEGVNRKVQSVLDWGSLQGTVLMVCVKTQSGDRFMGSAFLITPGLALTAKHVFDPEARQHLKSGTCHFLAIGIELGEMRPWSITEITDFNHTDLTLLQLKPLRPVDNDHTFFQFPIRTRRPMVGENVSIIGFSGVPKTEGIPEVMLYGSGGCVSAFFPEMRDRGMYNFPVIQIDAGVLRGMSGGAVIDQEGQVIGVVSGDSPLDPDGLSYAAWIAPALQEPIRIKWPPGLYLEERRLVEIDKGTIYINFDD